ncbi:hypothetical protein DFH11DRAFT_356670 [Phellopilus nigrolimitatus]|nr:hypothetical protein DFH11DRAFT_356670 [Phellopilus nigrolimitatus]
MQTTGGNRTNSDGEGNSDTDSSGDSDDSSDYGDDDAGAGDSDGDGDGGENTGDESAGEDDDDDDDDDDVPPLPDLPSSAPATESLPAAHRRMIRSVRRFAHAPAPRKRAVLVAPGDTLQLNLSQRDIPDVTSVTLPTGVPDTQPSSTSDNVAGGSAAAAENARNTQKAQPNSKTTSAPKGQATHQAPPSKTTAGGSDSDCTHRTDLLQAMRSPSY